MPDKKVIDIGVVILHYNNVEDTLECVESFINKLDTKSYQLLVFDNCSPNGSGKILREKLEGIKNVEVYCNDKNLGFGGGNNKGIEILRDKYQPKYLVLSNNDIIVLENHFYKKIDEEYQRSGFAELGPMIVTADGRIDSNPISDIPYYKDIAEYNLRDYKSRLRARRYRYTRLRNFVIMLRYKFSSSFRKKRMARNRKDRSDGVFLKRRENIVCHGCFMIFSDKFFEHYKGINLHSFMYDEEDIIYLQIISKGLKTVYNPDILIYHKEGRSVSNTYKNSRKKYIFLYKRYIEAIEGYIRYLDELAEEGFVLKKE